MQLNGSEVSGSDIDDVVFCALTQPPHPNTTAQENEWTRKAAEDQGQRAKTVSACSCCVRPASASSTAPKPLRVSPALPITSPVRTIRSVRKDLAFYIKEHDEFEAKVREMEQRGADPHDIKQQKAVAEESANMIPDTQARIETAVADLRGFVEKNGGEAELAGLELLTEAKALVGEAEAADGAAEDGRGAAAGWDDDEEF